MIKLLILRTEESTRVYIFEYCGNELVPSKDDWEQIGILNVDEIEEIIEGKVNESCS